MTAGAQTLKGHVPRAISRFHLQPLRNLPSANRLNLAVSLPLKNQPGLDNLLQQIYDPRSPEYHHYLTPGQFTAQFGPSQQDYDTVVAYFKANGFAVTGTYSNRTLLDVSANVETIQKVFHTTLRVYRHPTENRTFYAPDTDPVISPGIAISHITGLDNFVIPRPLAKKMRWSGNLSGARPANYTGSGTNGEFMGKDFRAAYIPGVTLNGAGQSVALFELDAYYTSDITAYEQLAGLPNTTLTNISVDGGVFTPGSGDGEVSLDIEMAISLATNLSQVIVYEAPNGGNNSVLDELMRIADDDAAKQISSSWLIGDSSAYDTYYKQMASQGQSFFQASGDDGAFYSGISEWADDTNITLVGGTTLSTTGPGGAWSSETVWNWYSQGIGTGVGGGGVNFNNVPIPAYQQSVSMANNQGSTTLRNVPDVALTADDIFVYYNNGNFNGNEYFGGTSCAAPLWAAFIALVNQQALAQGESTVGFINPAVYAIGQSPNYANCFHDITTGNNTNSTVGNEWYATNGYDLCTGWGTPNGQNLINALAPPTQSPFNITPSTGFTAVGYTGGPFTPLSQVYVLTNSTASPVQWALTNNAPWLDASATSGTLPAGGATNVTFSLNAAANSLAAATYTTTVTFTNSATTTLTSLAFTLQVTEPLVITPGNGFTVNAAEGGPFSPAFQTFILTNAGSATLTWQGSASSWLDLSSISGTLAGGAGVTVTASLNDNAGSFAPGIYPGQVAFTDRNSGITQQRQITLSIGQNLVQNGGFETGDFTDWNFLGTVSKNLTLYNGVVNVSAYGSVAANFIHSGNDGAALGHKSFSYLSQSLATTPGQSYLLSFWLNNPGGYTPNQFLVDWNTNAVGTNTIFSQSNYDTSGTWMNLLFVLPATGTNTTLVFGTMNSNYYFGLDDINVWPVPLPTIRNFSSSLAQNALTLTWNTLTNVTYEVAYSTNLVNWSILSKNTALGSTLTVTNPIGSNPQAFYRILRLP